MNLLKNQTDEIKSSNMDFDYLTEQFDFEDDGLPDFRVRTPIFKRVGIAAGIFAVLVGMYLFFPGHRKPADHVYRNSYEHNASPMARNCFLPGKRDQRGNGECAATDRREHGCREQTANQKFDSDWAIDERRLYSIYRVVP